MRLDAEGVAVVGDDVDGSRRGDLVDELAGRVVEIDHPGAEFEGAGGARIGRRLGIGAHTHATNSIRPAHDAFEIAR